MKTDFYCLPDNYQLIKLKNIYFNVSPKENFLSKLLQKWRDTVKNGVSIFLKMNL